MTAALIAFALIATAVAFYNFMQGETLVRDLIDEWRIHRSPVALLDTACSTNPNRSTAVVCLTTLPSRIAYIDGTLKSLMRQTRAPAKIRLYVPEFSTREGTRYDIPPWLRDLDCVEVIRTQDWGPATKLIPAVRTAPPDQALVVVDDDRIYPATLVEDLENASARMPDAAVALGGWVAPRDLVDRQTTALSSALMRAPAPLHALRLKHAREVDVLQGLAGFLVKPRFFDLAALCDYSAAPAAAFYVDDVWISAHCIARKYVVPARRAGHVRHRHRARYRETSLARVNRGSGGERNNTIVLRHFADRWRVGVSTRTT